jgi:hypothetical protein
MPTCDYCWTPYTNKICPHCEKEHKRIGKMNVGVDTFSGKKGRPTLDIQEGNREQQFADHSRWADNE